MSSTLIDSAYYRDMVSAEQMRGIFSDEGRFAAWLEVEVALARVQARLGLIPQQAATAIGQAAKLESLDVATMKEHYHRVGFPIVPLVKQLGQLCDPESARWIHWGATTQDIVDTGLSLQIRKALDWVQQQFSGLIAGLKDLTIAHRHTVMVGRTFQQHAAPITFGFKTAVWLDELLRHRDRLLAAQPRATMVQFGGAVGTLATLGQDGLAVRQGLARELDLSEPDISWHTARDGWAELVFCLSCLGATLTKIAVEISTLMRTEVDEVREPYQPGRGGSSTMPQKRNPIACPLMIAIGHRMRELVGSQLTAMIQEHERAVGAMPIEWMVIPEAFLLLSGSLQHANAMIPDLDVNAQRMLHNLQQDGGLLMAESVMMGLAPQVGRGRAHEMVTSASTRAIDGAIGLRQALLESAEIMTVLSAEQLDSLLEPANYLGRTQEMIDLVLEKV